MIWTDWILGWLIALRILRLLDTPPIALYPTIIPRVFLRSKHFWHAAQGRGWTAQPKQVWAFGFKILNAAVDKWGEIFSDMVPSGTWIESPFGLGGGNEWLPPLVAGDHPPDAGRSSYG